MVGAARLLFASALACAIPLPGSGQEYAEPERGSVLRTDILDVMRPIAEWAYAAPVEFVVVEMRVSEDVALAVLDVQRPGGVPIDVADAPIVLRDGLDPGMVDGAGVAALLKKSGRMWVPVQSSAGATDLWYSATEFCEAWQPVLPEYCHGK